VLALGFLADERGNFRVGLGERAGHTCLFIHKERMK
jgi:hypothetical protein